MIDLSFVLHDYSGARTYANELPYYYSNYSGIASEKLYLESSNHCEYTTIEGKRAGSTVIDSITAPCPGSFSKALAVCYRHWKGGDVVKIAIYNLTWIRAADPSWKSTVKTDL